MLKKGEKQLLSAIFQHFDYIYYVLIKIFKITIQYHSKYKYPSILPQQFHLYDL